MRLCNKEGVPKYSPMVNAVIKPGCFSRELPDFKEALEDIEKGSRGFDLALSHEDVEILARFCAKYLLPLFSEKFDVKSDAAVAQLKKTLEDPDGTKVIGRRQMERVKAIHDIRTKARHEFQEKEARIRSESNMIGLDGNPIPKAVATEAGQKVDPKLHPEMHNDLKSIIENNLAVMTTASGKPIMSPHDHVAPPGGTPVSHNPKDYQKPRSAPYGQPEFK